jgi:hypothetical protein
VLPVIEALLVLAGVVLLAGAGLVAPLVSPESVVAVGLACTAAGMAFGVPTGLWYHVRLRACLAVRGELPERWWLRPVALHGRLRPAERPAVMRWFYAGGLGFLLTVLGCAVVVLGVVLQVLAARSAMTGQI